MKRSVLLSLIFSSLLLHTVATQAQSTFPVITGERARYTAYIEMPQAYISGVCILINENGIIKGSLFNEFGVSAIDFNYNPNRKKVKLLHVIKMMDKWYIRYVLRKDMKQLMQRLQQGETFYENQHRHIKYTFTPITDDVTQ